MTPPTVATAALAPAAVTTAGVARAATASAAPAGRVAWGRAGGAGGRTTGDPLHSRACAAVTAASCLAHVWLAAGSEHGPWLSALMLAMAAVCLPCTVHVWRHSSVSALRRIMASGVAMAVFHAFLLFAPAGSAHRHAGSGPAAAAAATAMAGEPEGSAAAALLAVIALEITTAFLASTLVARLRPRP